MEIKVIYECLYPSETHSGSLLFHLCLTVLQLVILSHYYHRRLIYYLLQGVLCENAGKITFVVGCSLDVTKKGLHAGKIVKEISSVVQGSGGGRPDFAVGGGKELAKIEEAMLLGEKLIKESLNK